MEQKGNVAAPRRKYRKQFKIPGEYARVSQRSSVKHLLRRAHRQPITVDEAKRLISQVLLRYGIMEDRVRQVWRAGGRGKVVHRNSTLMPWQCTLTLPNTPLTTPDKPVGQLRVGLVLHELAHILEYWDHYQEARQLGYDSIRLLFPTRNFYHGWNFVGILDRLLKRFYNEGN